MLYLLQILNYVQMNNIQKTRLIILSEQHLSAFMFYIFKRQFLSDTNDKIKSKRDSTKYLFSYFACPFLHSHMFFFLIRNSKCSRRHMISLFKYSMKIAAILISNRCYDITYRKRRFAHKLNSFA